MAKKPKIAVPKDVEFDFIKGNLFRVISADGAFGGLGPQGRTIHMGLYSERQPYPTKVVHSLGENRALGGEIVDKRQSRKAFVRELEADVSMDLQSAISVQMWLTARIQELATLHKVQIDFTTGQITPIAVAAKSSNGTNGKEKK